MLIILIISLLLILSAAIYFDMRSKNRHSKPADHSSGDIYINYGATSHKSGKPQSDDTDNGSDSGSDGGGD